MRRWTLFPCSHQYEVIELGWGQDWIGDYGFNEVPAARERCVKCLKVRERLARDGDGEWPVSPRGWRYSR